MAFRETVEAYESAHVPYIRAIPGAIGWVYKILALEKETERLLFNDPPRMPDFCSTRTRRDHHLTQHDAQGDVGSVHGDLWDCVTGRMSSLCGTCGGSTYRC